MNIVETIIKEIGKGSELNEKGIDKGIWKSAERKTERRASAIGGIRKVPNAKESTDEKTATPLMRDVVSTDANTVTPSIEPNASTDGAIVKRITKKSEFVVDCIIG